MQTAAQITTRVDRETRKALIELAYGDRLTTEEICKWLALVDSLETHRFPIETHTLFQVIDINLYDR